MFAVSVDCTISLLFIEHSTGTVLPRDRPIMVRLIMQVSLSHLFVLPCLALCQAAADGVTWETGKCGQQCLFSDLLSPKWQVKSPTGKVNAIYWVSVSAWKAVSTQTHWYVWKGREVDTGICRSCYVLSENMKLWNGTLEMSHKDSMEHSSRAGGLDAGVMCHEQLTKHSTQP